ncbi:MAG: glycerol-3-phosphate 1-O-acyltransferase PlsY [Methylococcales bacterium]|nr:glycerol-3-phosphate 1-O-acyltransferase PlsY [Methylococcales bacterium]
MMIEWLLVPGAYLIGSISSAVIVCQLMGLPDPRGQGSGNPGATNVVRIGGKKAGVITLVGDALKGVIPVLIAQLLNVETLLLACVVFAAFIGHLYPVFFEFKGGKGVATSLGVALGVDVFLGFSLLATWLLVYKISKISSLSALVASIFAPIYVWFMVGDGYLVITFTITTILLLYRHTSNIKKLIKGTET